MADELPPLPTPRPPTVIPLPKRRPVFHQATATGTATASRASVPHMAAPTTQPQSAWGTPLATAPDIQEPQTIGLPTAAPAWDPVAAQASVQEAAARLRAAAHGGVSAGPSPSPLAPLRAQFDSTYQTQAVIPSGMTPGQAREMSGRAWERWAETDAGTTAPPVIDPFGGPSLSYYDEWESRRSQENTDRMLTQLGLPPTAEQPKSFWDTLNEWRLGAQDALMRDYRQPAPSAPSPVPAPIRPAETVMTDQGAVNIPAAPAGQPSVSDVLAESQRLIDEARARQAAR